MNTQPPPSTLFSFFHTLNTQKQYFRNLQKLMMIEAFEKLHNAFTKRKLKNKKIFISRLKNCHRKRLKNFIKLIFRLNFIIDSHNLGLYHEFFWSLFYQMHKKKLNQHINQRFLKIGETENKKNLKKFKNLVAILKIFGFGQKINNKRTLLMKYLNRWRYL